MNKSIRLVITDYLQLSTFNKATLVLASIGINLLSLALPITLMQVYDRIIAHKATATLTWILAIGIIATLIESAFRYSRFSMTLWFSTRFEYNLGNKVFEKILSAPINSIKSFNPGELLDSLQSVNKLKSMYSGQIFQAILDLPFSLIFVAIVTFLNLKAGVYLIFVLLTYSLVILLFKSKIVDSRSNTNKVQSDRTSYIVEILSQLHTIKSFAHEENRLRKMEHHQLEQTKYNAKNNLFDSIPENVIFIFSQAILFGIIAICAMDIMTGKLTLGVLTACTILGGRSLGPLHSFYSFWIRSHEYKQCKETIEKYLSLPSRTDKDRPDLPQTVKGHVSLAGVTHYHNERAILQDINYMFPAGKIIGIKGKDKSGTTTLLNILTGDISPHEGEVYIDNYDLKEFNVSSSHNIISYVPEFITLFKGTLLENITSFNTSLTNLALDTASMLGLDPLISALPYGYETPVDSESSKSLPTDIKIRIGIARAIVKRPKIIIFDKIDHSMDHETESLFKELLKRLKGKMTIFFVSKNHTHFDMADILLEITNNELIEINSRDIFSELTKELTNG